MATAPNSPLEETASREQGTSQRVNIDGATSQSSFRQRDKETWKSAMIKIDLDTNVCLSSDPSRRVEVRVAVCTVSPTTNPVEEAWTLKVFLQHLHRR